MSIFVQLIPSHPLRAAGYPGPSPPAHPDRRYAGPWPARRLRLRHTRRNSAVAALRRARASRSLPTARRRGRERRERGREAVRDRAGLEDVVAA